MATTALYRLDETTWSFYPQSPDSKVNFPKEVRIITPSFSNRYLDFTLAKKVAELIDKEEKFPENINLTSIADTAFPSDLKTNWTCTDVTKDKVKAFQSTGITILDASISYQAFTKIPFKVIELQPSSYTEKLSWTASRSLAWIKSWVVTEKAYVEHAKTLKMDWELQGYKTLFLEKGAFTDHFTELAKTVLQEDETPFISEKACQGSYRFSLDTKSSTLKLELIPTNPTPSVAAEDDPVLAAVIDYRDFLVNAFGWRILDSTDLFEDEIRHYGDIFANPANAEEQLFGYLKSTYGIDFTEMIQQRKPLLPDHVFKCNMAVCNIEMPQVESLYLRIVKRLNAVPELDEVKKTFPDDTKLYHPNDPSMDINKFLEFFENFTSFLLDPISRKRMGKDVLFLNMFSLREIRGLYIAFTHFEINREKRTYERFLAFLHTFEESIPGYELKGFGEEIRELTPLSFHRLMEILHVDTGLLNRESSREPENFFTGRKIVHLGIIGYKTMGDTNVYDPSRNLFELLHVYPGLLSAQTDNELHEILSVVVSKKSLWSQYPLRPLELLSLPSSEEQKNVRRVGRIIPFPAKNDVNRYYFVDGLINDNRGNVNYVLVPASKGYLEHGTDPKIGKRDPLVIAYRSTASDPEAESSIDSIMADTNPKKVGSLDFTKADEYENAYFSRCTMPIWVAYLILGNEDKAASYFKTLSFKSAPHTFEKITYQQRKDIITEFMAWQMGVKNSTNKAFNTQPALQNLDRFIAKIGKEQFEKFLMQTLEGLEWVNDKIAQDIHFVGHSLGGTLGQSGLYHYGPEANRIPLVGCNFKCFAFDTPGVTVEEAQKFKQFGREHKDLLQNFGQKWEIHYQFEYQDVVPLGGESLLGAEENTENQESWLALDANLCTPRDTATDLAITTKPTHGRRFLQANEQEDYTSTSLKITDLYELKRARYFSLGLASTFGYLRLGTTGFAKLTREGPGYSVYGMNAAKKATGNYFHPPKYELDENGVLYCTYKGYTTIPA